MTDDRTAPPSSGAQAAGGRRPQNRRAGVSRRAVVAFQGEIGAYSHLACREMAPDLEPLPCATFEDAFAAVADQRADCALLPIENSIYGRVADIHHLLPESQLYVTAEHFQPIRHQLMAVKGAAREGLKTVESHVVALGQCRRLLRRLGAAAVTTSDTAGAARRVAESGDPTRGAIASRLAAEIYGLDILERDVEDAGHNTTRFLMCAPSPGGAPPGDGDVITTLVFRVRNVPAALYKAMGGFATNGVNMTKLESYMVDGSFTATQFYADVEGHPESRPVRLALEELDFFCTNLKILGVYPAHPYRAEIARKMAPAAVAADA